jgi:hypothetical protein
MVPNAPLPVEIFQRWVLPFDPLRRLLLEAFQEIRQRYRPAVAAEDMDVILDTADNQGWTSHVATGPDQICMHLGPKISVSHERNSILGRENDV